MSKTTTSYEDIIDLPHPVSKKHAQMSIHDRAAQFSPFSALTGHDAAIAETARQTQSRIQLDENRKQELDQQLQQIDAYMQIHKEMKLICTYFVPDSKKEGGSYQTITESLIRVNHQSQEFLFAGGLSIAVQDIYDLVFAEDSPSRL